MFCAFPIMRVFDGRAFFVSLSVPSLQFVENCLVRHRINLFCSRDGMITQFGQCEIVSKKSLQIIFLRYRKFFDLCFFIGNENVERLHGAFAGMHSFCFTDFCHLLRRPVN